MGGSSQRDARRAAIRNTTSNDQGPGVLLDLDGGKRRPARGTQAQTLRMKLRRSQPPRPRRSRIPPRPVRAAASEPEGGLPPILEFVIDVTGSMADQRAYPNDPTDAATKWQETPTRTAGRAGGACPPPGRSASPTSGNRTPVASYPDQSVPIGVLSGNQLTSINDSIQRRGPRTTPMPPTTSQGATPTLAAWRAGLSELRSWTTPAGYEQSPATSSSSRTGCRPSTPTAARA